MNETREHTVVFPWTIFLEKEKNIDDGKINHYPEGEPIGKMETKNKQDKVTILGERFSEMYY